jgi:flavin-dependent dehydrogenase
MLDVVIAGGGIAGSTLAVLLGRRGLRVELFERSRFPREKPCGEGVMPAGVGVLRRLGVAEAVGGAPFYGVRYHFGARVAEGRFPEVAGVPVTGCGQRRRHLDRVLFQAAADTPGVGAHSGAVVEDLLFENERITGLIVDGEHVRARLVVAADGARSLIRRRLRLDIPTRKRRVAVRAHFRLPPGQELPAFVNVFEGDRYELYVTPLPERELNVVALADSGAWKDSAIHAFHRWCREEPLLAAWLEGATQVSSFMGMSPLAGRARAGIAPGIVLLGDAAGFLDPITGSGMTQALVSAELLAEYIDGRLGKSDGWLAEFERVRKAMQRDHRILTEMVLWCARHRRVAQHLLVALAHSPALFSHLVGVCGGLRSLTFASRQRMI